MHIGVRYLFWTLFEERPDERVSCTEGEFTPGDWSRGAWPLRYLVLQIRKKQGRLFAGPDTRYLAVVSNRAGAVPALIRPACAAPAGRWHWQKPASSSGETAGTIQPVHDVTKHELGAAVPPCGRFGANAAWYRLSLLPSQACPRRRAPPAIQAPDCPAAGRVTPRAPARCACAVWRALQELTHPARGVRVGRLVSARAFGGQPAGHSKNLAVGLASYLRLT